jgi:hypothetical protein
MITNKNPTASNQKSENKEKEIAVVNLKKGLSLNENSIIWGLTLG